MASYTWPGLAHASRQARAVNGVESSVPFVVPLFLLFCGSDM